MVAPWSTLVVLWRIPQVLVQLDEVNAKVLHANADKLKNIVTSDTIRSEAKGVNAIEVKTVAVGNIFYYRLFLR